MLHLIQPKIQPSHTSGQREIRNPSSAPLRLFLFPPPWREGRNQTAQTDLEGPGVLGWCLLSSERVLSNYTLPTSSSDRLTLLLSDLYIGVSSEEQLHC